MTIADLTQSYAGKTDEELLRLAEQREHLTIEAQSVMAAELARRRIEAIPQSVDLPTKIATTPFRNRNFEAASLKTGEFVEEVLRFYSQHRWIFMGLIFPAVILGVAAITFFQHEARLMQWSTLQHPDRLNSWTVFKVGLVAWIGHFVSWMIFCFAFVAICSAVEQSRAGFSISFPESLKTIFERTGQIVRLSVVLFGLFVVLLLGIGSLVLVWALPLAQSHFGRLSSFTWTIATYAAMAVIALLFSRFSLALPALSLDDHSLTDSLIHSYQLTKGRWPVLAVLVLKGVFVSYIAGMLPFWLIRWIPVGTSLPSWWFTWVLPGASVLCVTVVEPVMFIGFAMLYLKTTAEISVKTQTAIA